MLNEVKSRIWAGLNDKTLQMSGAYARDRVFFDGPGLKND